MFEVGVGFFKECGPQRILGLCTGQYLLQKKAIARRLAALCLVAFRPSIELRGAKSDSLTTRRLLALKDSFHIKEKLSTLCSGLGWFLTGIFGSHERYFISALEAKLNPPASVQSYKRYSKLQPRTTKIITRCSILTVAAQSWQFADFLCCCFAAGITLCHHCLEVLWFSRVNVLLSITCSFWKQLTLRIKKP